MWDAFTGRWVQTFRGWLTKQRLHEQKLFPSFTNVVNSRTEFTFYSLNKFSLNLMLADFCHVGMIGPAILGLNGSAGFHEQLT